MKFLGVALAALLGLAEGKRSISASQMKTRLANGEFNKQTLMANAKPYGNTARKLEEGEEFEITGLYSVQFNSCVSMTIQDEDVLSDDLISYSASGALVAEKSYIVFSACYTENCYYQAEDDKLTFITDLATFFQAFVDFLPNQVENYCEGCQQNADYCSGALAAEYAQAAEDEAAADDADEDAADDAEDEPDQDEEGEDEPDQEDEGEDDPEDGEDQDEDGPDEDGEEGDEPDDGERKLASKRKLANNKKTVEFIDCAMCNTYECFAEEAEAADDAVVDYVFEDALEWIEAFSECKELEYNDDLELFAGLICNEQGTGVEIGVFFDEDCTQHATKMSYSSMMTYADKQYFALSEEVVEYMFTNDFSCYQEEIEYTNPYVYVAEEDDNAEEDNGEAPEAAEWCKDLFDGELEAVSLYDCGVDADAEDNNEAEYDENVYTYDFYSYQLSENQYDDASEVCQVLKGTDGKTTVYSSSSAGALYTYKPNKSSGGMGTGWILVLVVLIAGALGAAATVVFKRKSNSKRDPLITSTADGTLA